MKITIQRSALLPSLQMVQGVVERRQTLPILANVLLTVKNNRLFLTATDLEIELISSAELQNVSEEGVTTVSARKLADICRALPDDTVLKWSLDGNRLVLRAGNSRFSLATIPANDFPTIMDDAFLAEWEMNQALLKKMISKTHFAMGLQDVRHYLNGSLFDINQGVIKCIATDGHRLAFSKMSLDDPTIPELKFILPRKSILELMRLLDAQSAEKIKISVGAHHFRVTSPLFTFTSKLISAQYPDYTKLIPLRSQHLAIAERETFKQALTRVSILSNEKFRSIRVQFASDHLSMVANNPEQEEAEEKIALQYQGPAVEMGFNVTYLLDVLSSMTSDAIRCSFTSSHGGIRFEPEVVQEDNEELYVVMPMRL